MNTRYLKEFLVIAEELNFSAAAKRLYTTRPTLSEHLAELEDELGCKLVERGRGKPTLTPLGRRFLGTASDLLGQWDEVVGEYRDLSDNLLTVTVSATNLPWLEAPLLRARHRIVEKWPEGKIDIVTDNGPLATVDALGERKNDIVVVGCKSFSEAGHRLLTKEHPGFVLNAETTHLFMTEDNPLLGRDTIRAADLDGAVLLLPPRCPPELRARRGSRPLCRERRPHHAQDNALPRSRRVLRPRFRMRHRRCARHPWCPASDSTDALDCVCSTSTIWISRRTSSPCFETNSSKAPTAASFSTR